MDNENSRLRKLAMLLAVVISVTQLTACENNPENRQRVKNAILIGAAVAGAYYGVKQDKKNRKIRARNTKIRAHNARIRAKNIENSYKKSRGNTQIPTARRSGSNYENSTENDAQIAYQREQEFLAKEREKQKKLAEEKRREELLEQEAKLKEERANKEVESILAGVSF